MFNKMDLWGANEDRSRTPLEEEWMISPLSHRLIALGRIVIQ